MDRADIEARLFEDGSPPLALVANMVVELWKIVQYTGGDEKAWGSTNPIVYVWIFFLYFQTNIIYGVNFLN